MKSPKLAVGLFGLLSIVTATLVAYSERGQPLEFTPEETKEILRHAPLAPAPSNPTNRVADDARAARLGQSLFFDGRLSANGKIACVTCHDPGKGWSNGKRRGEGLGITSRHVPALWNVAYNRWYFWDGRADTLWAQALQPIEAPEEAGGDRVAVAHTVAGDPALRGAYESIFGPLPDLSGLPRRGKPVPLDPADPLAAAWSAIPESRQIEVNRVFTNLGKALEAYERRIISRNSPFDRFAAGLRRGDRRLMRALSTPQQRGLKLFIGKGNCILCHSGPSFSDGEFHNLRLPVDTTQPLDPGRYDGVAQLLENPFNSVGPYSDDPAQRKIRYLVATGDSWGQFKTPSLRNVAETPPYTHDGVFASLREVVEFYSTLKDAAPMGHHDESILKPLRLSETEIADLIAFLQSLSGEPLPPDLIAPAALLTSPETAPRRLAAVFPALDRSVFPLPATHGGRSHGLPGTGRPH